MKIKYDIDDLRKRPEWVDRMHEKGCWGALGGYKLGPLFLAIFAVKGRFNEGDKWWRLVQIHPKKKAPHLVAYRKLIRL